MKHRLKISVSDKTENDGVVACRRLRLRKRLLDKLLGPTQRVTLIVPGQTVECLSVEEVSKEGDCDE